MFAQQKIAGKIFDDANKNGVWDSNEKPLSGVLVSNGRDLVKSNQKGEYSITAIKDNSIFIIKPTGYISPILNGRVQFYVPDSLISTPGLKDFPLIKNSEKNDLTVALLGDPQVDVIDDVHHVYRLVTEELAGKGVDFAVPLGDLTFDNHAMFAPLSAGLGLIGAPIFYVMGNHDQNYNAESLQLRDKNYETFFGPSYYGFEFGTELCIVLNNIYPKGKKGYEGKLDEDQYTFLSNLLKEMKPQHQSVKVYMHIPAEEMTDSERFLNMFNDYEEVLIVTGHTHTQYQKYFERANHKPIHELVAGAVCGSWWQGPHDSDNIPFSYMYDGTPKGYWLLQTKENLFSYKVSGKQPEFQIEITVPEINEWDTALNRLNVPYVYANVFAGTENTRVKISFDNGNQWQAMEKVSEVSPKLKALFEFQELGRYKGENISNMPFPKTNSDHLWKLHLPDSLTTGTYLVTIKAVDEKTGLNATGYRVLQVP